MTVEHCLISPFGLGVCAAWAKPYKVIARDITIRGIFAFLLSNNLKQIMWNKMWVNIWNYKRANKVI